MLVIDDNRAIHDDFRKILSPSTSADTALDATEAALFGETADVVTQARFEIDSAYQGQEGVQLVQAALAGGRPYAMAFVDVRMPPGLDGVETARLIWALDPDLQVVLCTAYSDYSWDEMFERLGQRDGLLILKKPFDGVEALQLAHALTAKWSLHRLSRQKLEGLERRVGERTSELQRTNSALQIEVAERKQAEVEAARSRQQLRDLIDGLGPSMFVGLMTPEGVMLECNRPALAAAGLTPEDVLGKHFEETYWWAYSPTVQQQLRATIEKAARGEASRYDVKIRVAEGVLIDAEFSLEPVRDETGEIAFLVPSGVIITERKRAEIALQDSEERYRALIEWSPESLSVTRGGTILFLNPVAAEMLGASSAQELIGKSIFDFAHPDSRQLVAVRMKSQYELGGVLPMLEERLIKLDGTIIDVEIHGTSILYDGTPATFSSMRDVTERKRSDDALRKSERRFSDTLNNLELAAMMLDRDARLTYVNEYLLRLTGWQRGDVMGRDWLEVFVPPENVIEAREAHENLLADLPAAWHNETEIVTRSGARRLMRWNNSVLRSAAGEVTGTASIGEDITERHRLEVQLFESQKLETVGKLAGGVAHEFNSILTAIIGQSELLLGALTPGSSMLQSATEIRGAADRAAVLTRQLLAYGRKQFLKPESLDLNRVLSSMGDMLRHLMGAEVDVQIASAPNLHAVRADAGQVEHVIMNLAMNSRDAMPHGGRLTMETANVTFDSESAGRLPGLSPGDYVMLAITDTGVGMTEDAKAHLFEPFFTTKGVGQGSGLGLSTCYGIVRQSGGHIGVESELARGTTFTIYLPQVEQPSNAHVPRLDSSELPRGTETILLVEADPALREMAATLLKRLGYSVLPAANGVEALRLTPQRPAGHVDLLFTDIVMPHMNGKELSERVLAIDPQIRVLFSSSYTENAKAHQGISGEGIELLQKPYAPAALAHKVRNVLDGPSAPPREPVPTEFGITPDTNG